ncbi:MAG TPA: hypothetical protein VJU16_05815, partial [Planctomycetota bacterium]|nr:hypothetical protein [Planctomycetota bacterium]
NPTVAAEADNLLDALRALVFHHDNGTGHFYAYGLSVYFPSRAADFDGTGYAATAFATATQWDEMLASYYAEIAGDTTAPTLTAPVVSPSASQAASATLASTVGGTDVATARLYAGTVSGSVVTVLFAADTTGPSTTLTNGRRIADWSGSPTDVTGAWDSRAFRVSNGTTSFFALAEDRGGWRTVEAIHRSAGLADDKAVALVFNGSGALVACLRDTDGIAPRAIALGAGDELDILTLTLDFTTPSAPVKDFAVRGTLTVGAPPLTLQSAPVANGAYVLGLWAEDGAGNLFADDAPVTVSN